MSSNLSISEADRIAVPPARKTWTGPDPTEPAAMAAFFEEHGFLILRGVLDADELQELDGELQRLARDYESLSPVREGFNVEHPSQWPDPDTPVFRKIGGIYDLSEACKRLCHKPRVGTALEPLLGPEIDLYRDVVMMKQAHIGREKPWHQDGPYWSYRPYRLISAMTALDPANAANGGLQVIPGSHKREFEHHGSELQVTLSEAQQGNTTYVALEPGDTLLFHCLLLHGSEPNRSDRNRRVIIFSYRDHHLEYIGKGPERPDMPVFRY